MHAKKYSRTVRLTGFAPDEQLQIADVLALAPTPGPAYFCLHADSLQAPDITIANGDDLDALTALAAAPESSALIIGPVTVDFAHPHLSRPIEPDRLFGELAALARAAPSETMPERRRHARLDLDLTDPAELAARRRAPPNGAILLVDHDGVLRDHVATLLGAHKAAVQWTDSATTAERLCEETPVSVVLINTSTPDVDGYDLCATIKALPQGKRIAVVLLVGPTCTYDPVRASAAGVRGLLDRPVADHHLMAALQRLLSLPVAPLPAG